MSGVGFINRFESGILFLGDIVVFYASLWAALLLRHLEVPAFELWELHATPFTIIFVVWVFVFFVAGLYEKHTTMLKSRLPHIVFRAQVTNGAIAVLFFFLIPYFNITPKTVLFLYLVISFLFIVFWRQTLFSRVARRAPQNAVLIASGREMRELFEEVNENPRYGLYFVSSINLDEMETVDFQSEILDRIYAEGIATIAVDTKSEKVIPILPKLYNLIFSHVRFIDMHRVYEEIFDRVPLSLVRDSWFLENISVTRRFTYEFLKRVMDILISFVLLVVSLTLFPFVWLAVKLDDGGKLFIRQERIGKNNRTVTLYKVRSMTGEDNGDDALKSTHAITRAGSFFRKTRIDELPQLWNVLKGDLSLIGPRPELPALVRHYEQEVSYYNIRHLVKPGLSGWGQINDYDVPRNGIDVEKTRRKLSYDLYYIKNRSFLLDIKIALKTLKVLLSRSGV